VGCGGEDGREKRRAEALIHAARHDLRAIDGRQRIQHRINHGAAAMDMEFGDVFAGKTVRRFEPQQQAAIDDLALRVTESL
jgi:hypothetical protein